jgi:hypothetical protein
MPNSITSDESIHVADSIRENEFSMLPETTKQAKPRSSMRCVPQTLQLGLCYGVLGAAIGALSGAIEAAMQPEASITEAVVGGALVYGVTAAFYLSSRYKIDQIPYLDHTLISIAAMSGLNMAATEIGALTISHSSAFTSGSAPAAVTAAVIVKGAGDIIGSYLLWRQKSQEQATSSEEYSMHTIVPE